AGGVQHVGREGASLERFGVGDAVVDFHFAGRTHSHPGSLHVKHFEQVVVVLVEDNGCAGGGAEFLGSADVVDVSVGDDDLVYYQVVFADEREHVVYVVAGVNDHGFAGVFIADDGAVALQRAYGQNFVDHGFIVASLSWE